MSETHVTGREETKQSERERENICDCLCINTHSPQNVNFGYGLK